VYRSFASTFSRRAFGLALLGTFALLAGAEHGLRAENDQADVIKKLLAFRPDDRLGSNPVALVSLHYPFYLSRAIDKAGSRDVYLDTLGPWQTMLDLGLTTTPEYEDPTRSDTHAWSAHPIYDLLTIVAGIHPAAPGFARVRIAPHPGRLDSFDASMPHSQGSIAVSYRSQSGSVRFNIDLPTGIEGALDWKGKQYPLHEGKQTIEIHNGSRPA
jgi:alpha-L-rhamnosidase